MDSVKQYLLSVICAAIACALVGSLGEKKGTGGALLKLVTGVFLVFTVISPVRSLKLDSLSFLAEDWQSQAAAAAAMGSQASEESLAAYIKAETEAYILDKAAAMELSLTVEVSLNESYLPESAVLTGEISEFARFRMETILEQDLGIAKENQQWNE